MDFMEFYEKVYDKGTHVIQYKNRDFFNLKKN